MRRWRVYLLHTEFPWGETAHYVGITTRGRLLRRLREHVNGYGTKKTAHTVRAGATLQLARTWATDDRKLEAEKEKAAPKDRLCPICAGRPRLSGYPINRSPRNQLLRPGERALPFLSFPHDRSEPQERLRKGPVFWGSP